jgi:hypothetical protein
MCGVWRGYDITGVGGGEFALQLVSCQRVAPPYWRSDTHIHTLFKYILTVIISTVGVLTLNGQTIQLPPTVSIVRFWSSFSGRYVTTVFPYVMFHLWSSGILSYLMNTMVSVPLVPGMPWARRPNSLVYDLPHRLEYFGLCSSCHISMSSPVSLLRTALMILLGNLRWARLDA